MSEKKPGELAKGIAGLVIIGGAVWWYFGGGLDAEADRNMQKITNHVATDSVTQYQLATRHGNPTDICVQAGMVVAAYLQAKDEANYAKWKQIDENDCKRAGIPTAMQ